jgi:intracellular multiplication protein IcmD
MKDLTPSTVRTFVGVAGCIALSLYASSVMGADDITKLTDSISKQATSIAKLMSIAAYVAGVGFALGGILQFKAHKDAPQQTPLSKPVVMIVVAACLLFLPTILNIAGESLFGGSKQSAAKAGGGQELGGE